MHEHVIAAGADSEVLFWDRRTGKPMGSFQDAHAEEVTQVPPTPPLSSLHSHFLQAMPRPHPNAPNHPRQLAPEPAPVPMPVFQVKFHPTQPNVFLSASTDGLISVYDMSNGLDEDDGFMVMPLLAFGKVGRAVTTRHESLGGVHECLLTVSAGKLACPMSCAAGMPQHRELQRAGGLLRSRRGAAVVPHAHGGPAPVGLAGSLQRGGARRRRRAAVHGEFPRGGQCGRGGSWPG